MLSPLASQCFDLAKTAGNAILDIYNTHDFLRDTLKKSDDSPLTKADLESNKILHEGLRKILPGVPILSEESEEFSWEIRRQWSRYWLIDPLDGTKEFLKKNGEFSVNIALIENHKSILGVVWAPALEEGYIGENHRGAFKIEKQNPPLQIQTRQLKSLQSEVAVITSRSHGSKQEEVLFQNLRSIFTHVHTQNFGSSLKICKVAEGQADIYPRFGPTSEWDIAAAHAVLESAGGLLVKMDFQPFLYNTKESLLNPSFVALGSDDEVWKRLKFSKI